MNCTRVDYVGIAVEDLVASVKWYERTLSLHSKGTEVAQKQQVTTVFLSCGDSELELLGSISPKDSITRFAEESNEGIQHITIRVDDIDAAPAGLKEEGVRLIDQAPRYGVGGARTASPRPKAVHGVLLELCEKK